MLTDFAASGKKFDFKSLVMNTITTSSSVEKKVVEKIEQSPRVPRSNARKREPVKKRKLVKALTVQLPSATSQFRYLSSFVDDVPSIIKLQSFVRGKIARIQVKRLKIEIQNAIPGHAKYFLDAEYKQTMRRLDRMGTEVMVRKDSLIDFNSLRVKKPTFTYKTEATYTGEWLVGMRDGHGV